MAWNKTGNIRGPKGDAGATGLQGGPAPNQVTGSKAGTAAELTLWVGTQDEYNSVPVKDNLTVYVVKKVSAVKDVVAKATTSILDGIPAKSGDLIIYFTCETTGTGLEAIPPAAGGRVPVWQRLGQGFWPTGGYGDTTAYYAFATSDNHTFGSWQNAREGLVIVVTGQPKGIGGFQFSVNADFSDTPQSITCPAITLQNNSGDSVIVNAALSFTDGYTATGAPSLGYSEIMSLAEDENGFHLFTRVLRKDDSTSDGAVTLGSVIPSEFSAVSALSIEILY